MKKEITSIKKLTDNPFLNMYVAHYVIDGDEGNYYIASRREEKDLAINNVGKIYTDAVRIVPYYYKNGEMYLVLTREFRHHINDWVYSTPTGCVEVGEDIELAVKREVSEEIGADVINMRLLASASYSSIGLTDEAIVSYACEVEMKNNQHLDKGEIIEYFSVPFKDAKRFADEKVNDMQAKILIKLFYYETLEKIRQIDNSATK